MANEQNPFLQENNALNKSARRNARMYAMQAIYQWQVAQADLTVIEKEFIRFQITKKTDFDYFKALLYGVVQKHSDIDEHITAYLGREFAEVDPVELAVLRLSTYELLERLDVPYPVIINEALELTKKFGSVDGYKFINGVLDCLAKKIRANELRT